MHLLHPASAFGGVLIANKTIDIETATEINFFFGEVVIAPDFSEDAPYIKEKNRICICSKKY